MFVLDVEILLYLFIILELNFTLAMKVTCKVRLLRSVPMEKKKVWWQEIVKYKY